MNKLWKWIMSLWKKPIIIKPPVVIAPPVEPPVAVVHPVVPEKGCTCDLSLPLLKEHREKGSRNQHEGSRSFRTCTDSDAGAGHYFVDPYNTPWLKGCIRENGNRLTLSCNPATGAHYVGHRLGGDDDRDSAAKRPEREFTIKPIAHIYFEHRSVEGAVEPPVVQPSTGNVPPFAKEADIPAPRKPPLANQTAPKSIKGKMPAKNADQCTQIRFGLQGYFRGEGYDVGYHTESNPRHGAICVSWRKEDPTYVEWEVLP
jgi:hypothetical protein